MLICCLLWCKDLSKLTSLRLTRTVHMNAKAQTDRSQPPPPPLALLICAGVVLGCACTAMETDVCVW
jgi:hypothetical protein